MNVHSGGGFVLLRALLQALPGDRAVVALLDARMRTPGHLPANLTTCSINPSLWQRLKAEWRLSKKATKHDTVLCFGNLPPIFKLRARTIVFLQNRYLLETVSLSDFSLKHRVRLTIERCWLRWLSRNASVFIVQTPAMSRLLATSGLARGKPIHILPFVDANTGYKRSNAPRTSHEATHDFIYVASGEPHKNHRRLVEAWILLADEGIYASLWLTLDPRAHPELCEWIDNQKKNYNLRIDNLGSLQHAEILRRYTQVRALIYPSTFESFGLPLIEARQAGLPVVASELDFVRDVLDPEQVFDPTSKVSIARAVKRFLQVEEAALPLLNAKEFMEAIIGKRDSNCES